MDMPPGMDFDALQQLVNIMKGPHEEMIRVQHLGRPAYGKRLKHVVDERLQLAHSAYQMNQITGGGFAGKGVVKLSNPPIENGMMWTVETLRKIVIEDYENRSNPEFSRVPALLTRIRELLRVYYNFKVTAVRTPDLKYCDFPRIFDISLPMHEVGLTLQLDPPRLKALIDATGSELERVVLDVAPDIGPYRALAMNYEKELRRSEEADDTDNLNVGHITDKADEDLAAYAAVWFYGDMMVAFLMEKEATEDQKRREKKSLQRLVFWSSNKQMRRIYGDCLTDSMRPIYWEPRLLVKFCQAGGLAALLGDCGMSTCKAIAEDAVLSLPDAAWEKQTKRSLFDATQSLLDITEWRESRKPLDVFTMSCYNIYKRYGISPFERASKNENWDEPVIFHYISHQLKKEGLPPKTQAEWRGLLRDFENLPDSLERRYRWSNLNISGQWSCIEFYGCDNKACPEKAELMRLRKRRVKGVRDAETEARLYDWGKKLKSCSSCHTKTYCTPDCQKAAWPSHKAECARERRNRNAFPT
ncbi:hypothetical protein SISSUDRAFT_1048022 [Sistotremastrum suecicum HHB10207 ss-3]|uniref:MYND-type domain-containing protein n=1 Tax=Sistotremastrum suecicum HHB10207 ss-3 TaxID=1314776 RepID=A0A166CTU1_9AGAM|nr:hypothetical protein SISSUDRAFT_1048022 [Sistotremastrum suecicum HHB10207 ss-3]